VTGVPDRLRWAVELVDPAADELLLEVGCGPGVAATLVCERLQTGRLLALDRSATAIARAARRNSGHLAAGRLVLQQCELRDLEIAPASLSHAFAIDVNVFWTTTAAAELQVLREALRPGGRMHLVYGVGPGDPGRVSGAVAGRLASAGFDDIAVRESSSAFGLTAVRP